MKSTNIVIASAKRLIASSIQKMLMNDGGAKIQATIYNKEDLTTVLQTSSVDILIIDQQMLSELYVWKNIHPKTLKRSIRVLLITSKKYGSITGELPGFIPDQVSYWEKGIDELQRLFDLLRRNKKSIFERNNKISIGYVKKFDHN